VNKVVTGPSALAAPTPGPWTIYDDSDELHICIKGRYSDIGGAHVATVLGRGNANLIRASLEMLGQLKYLHFVAGATLKADDLASLESTIAKAEGREAV
jgi:hypothetical protein